MNRHLKAIFSAIGFLTIIPIKNQTITPTTTAYFPIAGLFLGAILILLNFILSQFMLPHIIITALLLVVYIILTGGLHIDGLSDTVDGIAASDKDKAEILAMMSDSHIGAEGVIAIVCDTLLKFALLYIIPNKVFQNVLLTFPTISRWAMVISMLVSHPAKDTGVGKLFIESTNLLNSIIASLICIAISIFVFPTVITLIIIGTTGLVTICVTKFFARKVGGMTGDTIGAVNELVEIVSLMIFVIIYGK